jgi:hypothetical protein
MTDDVVHVIHLSVFTFTPKSLHSTSSKLGENVSQFYSLKMSGKWRIYDFGGRLSRHARTQIDLIIGELYMYSTYIQPLVLWYCTVYLFCLIGWRKTRNILVCVIVARPFMDMCSPMKDSKKSHYFTQWNFILGRAKCVDTLRLHTITNGRMNLIYYTAKLSIKTVNVFKI